MLKCPSCGVEIDLVGTKEAATELGVSASTFQGLKAREDFPAPRAQVGQGALWFREDVVAWKAQRERSTLEGLVGKLEEQLAGLPEEERRKLMERLGAGSAERGT